MYKVIIIDDEEIVRTGLCDLINWEEEGYTVCAEGKDGKDGLNKILTFWPELVLVDIKMPGLSGLEVIKEAREKGFQGEFLILTGYSEFEFARTAISYGVRGYLLKPVDEDELLENIRMVRKEQEEKQGQEAYHSTNEAVAREKIMRKIILKLESKKDLERQMFAYRMTFSSSLFCVAIIKDRELIPGNDNSIFLEKTRLLLGNEKEFRQSILMDDYLVVTDWNTGYKEWSQELARQNEKIGRKYGKELLIAVGHNVSSWYDLSHSYEFAMFLLEHEFLFSGKNVLTIDTIEGEKQTLENPSVEYFCMLIEVGDFDGIREGVKLFQQYCIREMKKELDIRMMVMYQVMQIKNWIEKKYGQEKQINLEKLLDQMNETEKLGALMEQYCNILQEMCKNVGFEGSENVIKRMYYYMEKNYDKDLKVETFAKLFNYNSNYLGKIFRKEIGDSFNNILDSIRIANAKRLLTETNLKVYQISEQVGYNNIDYFYLKFKKYVGISPKEYKRNFLTEE